MHRPVNYTKRLNLILFTYSFLLTTLVLIASFFIVNQMNSHQKGTEELYYTYDLNQMPNNSNDPFYINPIEIYENTITSIEIKEEYYKIISKNTVCIIIAVMTLTLIISLFVSKKISQRLMASFEEIIITSIDNLQNNIEENAQESELKGIKKTIYAMSLQVSNLLRESVNINSYIAHEQKNSLAILKGKLQIQNQTELVKIVDSMSNSLDDILALNSNTELLNEVVDVALICAEVFETYKKEYKNIDFDIDEENLLYIKGKSLLILRAVSNLVENAIKYGDNSHIKIKIYKAYNSVIIKVVDHGPGINRDNMNKIFDYQYRANHLKKDGYGIGLNLVQHVTELCHGIVYVESDTYVSTEFYMVFKSLTLD